MNILGFDTSLNKTYLALESEENIISETIESTKDKYHSAFLVKKIVEMLKNSNLKTEGEKRWQDGKKRQDLMLQKLIPLLCS